MCMKNRKDIEIEDIIIIFKIVGHLSPQQERVGDPYFQIQAWTYHIQRFFCKEEKVHVAPLHLRNVAKQLGERRWKAASPGPFMSELLQVSNYLA